MTTTATTKTIGLVGYGMSTRLSPATPSPPATASSSATRAARPPSPPPLPAAELGPLATAASVADAIRYSDIVSLSVPFKAAFDDATFPADAFAGKIVIETLNYYPDRDGRFPALDAREATSSELLQRRFHSARIVKAFSNISFMHLESLARPRGHSERSALPIAGDDGEAKASAAAFVEDVGFDAVDVGTLADSWRSEPNTPVFVYPYFARAGSLDGKVVTASDIAALVSKATKDSPVGGVLPKSSK